MKRLIHSIRIDKDSYETILIAWCICAILIWLNARFIHNPWISIPISVILVIFMCFITWFFRVPNRTVPDYENDRIVTSVADGKVVILEKVFEKEYLQRDCIQVSVYMDFFDVHCNFWPVNGKVTYYKYHPGKYLLAFHPKSSELNEHASCYSEPGNMENRGDQCGVIKFGSRIDMFLPLDAELQVKLGDKVKAVESVIAVLPEE